MYKIRDWLYISDYATAMSKTALTDAGIQGMLQLFQAIELDDIDTKFVPIGDGLPLLPLQIEKAIAFIHEQHNKKHRLLSTCGAGLSRSVTFAIIALKEIEGLSLADGYRAIYKHHPKAMPDYIHWKAIAIYYSEEDNFWEVWGELTLGSD